MSLRKEILEFWKEVKKIVELGSIATECLEPISEDWRTVRYCCDQSELAEQDFFRPREFAVEVQDQFDGGIAVLQTLTLDESFVLHVAQNGLTDAQISWLAGVQLLSHGLGWSNSGDERTSSWSSYARDVAFFKVEQFEHIKSTFPSGQKGTELAETFLDRLIDVAKLRCRLVRILDLLYEEKNLPSATKVYSLMKSWDSLSIDARSATRESMARLTAETEEVVTTVIALLPHSKQRNLINSWHLARDFPFERLGWRSIQQTPPRMGPLMNFYRECQLAIAEAVDRTPIDPLSLNLDEKQASHEVDLCSCLLPCLHGLFCCCPSNS